MVNNEGKDVGGRPGMSLDGRAGRRVQVVLPAEAVDYLEEYRGKEALGPVVRRLLLEAMNLHRMDPATMSPGGSEEDE